MTGSARVVEKDKAVLDGSVSVSGADTSEVTVTFLYSAAASTMEELVASGDTVEATVGEDGAVQAAVEGLQWKARYHFVAVARVRDTLFHGEVKSFWTELAPEAVDLGLSVKWASWNLGATSPEEYGDYYAWGEVESKEDYSWETYKWDGVFDVTIPGVGIMKNWGFSKYCPSYLAGWWAGEGGADGKTVLDPEDDAAAVRLGGGWRMPTAEEYNELRKNCTWEKTTINNVEGWKVICKKEGFTNRWIFLPAAGYQDGTWKPREGYVLQCFYWSSNISNPPSYALTLVRETSNSSYGSWYRNCGLSIRPVMERGENPGDGSQVQMMTGAATAVGTDEATLNGSVSVSGAAISAVSVSFLYSATASTVEELVASGVNVDATVEEDWTFSTSLHGLTYGTTYHYVAVATVRGEMFPGVVKSFRTELAPEAVDLGLSVKWASWNLGATAPEEYGDYYAWGETDPKEFYLWKTYAWGSGAKALTKYCLSNEDWTGEGNPDGKAVLNSEDDAASVRLGGKWRMPTYDEFTELRDTSNCIWEWTAMGGINGDRVTSRKAGFTDRWIFLPAAGYRYGADLSGVGSDGWYWSSSLYTGDSSLAWFQEFSSYGVYSPHYGVTRIYGRSVRPVSE